MARLLIDQDDGAFFNNAGDVRPELGMEYLKVTEFELKPRAKGPKPKDSKADDDFVDQSSGDAAKFISGGSAFVDENETKFDF